MKSLIRLLVGFIVSILTVQSVFSQTPDNVFVFLNKKADKAELPEAELKQLMDGHLANINRLAQEGKLVAAGPFDGGGGIFIFNSAYVDQVREWLQTDPGVRAHRWNVEVLPYYIQAGGVCKVNEPYNMVTYQFIRYLPTVTKDNINDLPGLFKKHHDYLKRLANTNSVLAQANFGDLEGGILILKDELTEEVLRQDEAVANGMLDVEIKKLWIAQGAFCEK